MRSPTESWNRSSGICAKNSDPLLLFIVRPSSLRYPKRFHAAVRRDHISECLPAVSGAAADREVHPAVVRRIGSGVERGASVFSTGAAGRVSLRALPDPVRESVAAGVGFTQRCSRRAWRRCRLFPRRDWKPAGPRPTYRQILLLLGATVGLPYMLLSAHQSAAAGLVCADAGAARFRTGCSRFPTSDRCSRC